MKEPTLENIAWLGLDAHAKFCLLSWMDDQGNRRQHWRFPTVESQLIGHLQRIPARNKHLALEECGLSRWLAQISKPHVQEVLVCDPKENHHISRHHHKCDEEDAYRLAHLYRLGALKKIWQPANDDRAVFKSAARAYLDAVQRQTSLKLQIKAHYRHWGVIPQGSLVYGRTTRQKYLSMVRQEGVRAQLQMLYQALDTALDVESQSRRLMVRLGKSFPEIEWLCTVPGVGIIGSHLFVAHIQEPARFESCQQLWRYCRLGIRDRSSDGKPLGYQKLDRCGHGVLKAISYRAWLAAMKAQTGAVYEFYSGSLKRCADTVHARLNTQRKILQTLWVLWKQNRQFDPKVFLGTEAQPAAKAMCG
jgi:transposase